MSDPRPIVPVPIVAEAIQVYATDGPQIVDELRRAANGRDDVILDPDQCRAIAEYVGILSCPPWTPHAGG